MAALSSTLPTGFTPALTADDAVDHTGLITVITAFAMFLVLGSLGIRVYSAYSRRILQTDDWAFAGTVVWFGILSRQKWIFDQIAVLINSDSCSGSRICGVWLGPLRLGENGVHD